MALTQEQLISMLEDTAALLRKTQSNLKKCPKARLTKGYIEARIDILANYWTSFKNAHCELSKITPKEQRGILPYFLNEEYFIYEDLYNSLQGDLRDMLSTLSLGSAWDASTSGQNVSGVCAQNNLVRLPRIQLPTFKGSYEEWAPFQDLFMALVHNNTMLSDVQKLHYLKTSVSGEAESLLKHMQITSDNYLPTWEILKNRYGNTRLVLNNTMKRLFNQKKMTTQSPVQLKALLDVTTECLHTFENLKISIGSWDPIIIFLLVQKLDPETHKNWEEHAYKENTERLPKWTEFKKFLESKFRTLELVSTNTREKPIKEHSYHVATPSSSKSCVKCNDTHTLCHCKEFIKMEPHERSDYVKTKNLCFNCLAPGHSAMKCRLSVSCRICHRRHHSLLHEFKQTEPAVSPRNSQPPASAPPATEEREEVQTNTVIASHLSAGHGVALLATAVVETTSEKGHIIPLRALIDQGSQASFISEKAAQILKLERQPAKGSVVGVGSTRTEIKHVVQLQVKSQWDSTFHMPVKAYVMTKQLTSMIPAKQIEVQPWPHLNNLNLADSNYCTPGSIDLLLGVKEYARILQGELIKGPPGTPCAQKTNLGWILFGDISNKAEEDIYLVMHHQVDVDDMLRSMWEIDGDTKRQFTKEEKQCEDIYDQTITRNDEGRYIVKLPFKTCSPQSPNGNTKEIATHRFLQLEKKFKKSPNLKSEYVKVINDYIEQQHIEEVPEKEKETKESVYLPHHPVVREDKETSKTRVVFDASCKGSNQISLNDELLVGPQLQEDLRSILMRWRMRRVCFAADITQMYRQILVTDADKDFQRILWRQDESEELKEYRLLRVTFGTAPAPYLAVKTLQQVARDEGGSLALATKTIIEDFYMDDVLSGADTAKEAISLAEDITHILSKGGLKLTKWSSNDVAFMESIDESKRSAKAHVKLNLDGTIKALGIVWNLGTDQFMYDISLPPTTKTITKRNILSDIQKLFDPLGWIAPATITAKMFVQKLWLEKLSWDEEITRNLKEEWIPIRAGFENAKNIKVDRWINTINSDMDNVQLHGFSDASMRAYAAVVYVRIMKNDGIVTKLIAARTRVAPLKTVSLPSLELCGALLLSKLMRQVRQAMRIQTSQMYVWTDSTIVIAWLSGEPNRWKPFVANRIVEIIENINTNRWYHVQSKDNPADLASRGIPLSELKTCSLWWNGPRWLSEKEMKFSCTEVMETDLEMKTNQEIQTYLNRKEDQESGFIEKFDMFDNLLELTRAIAYCRKFLYSKKNPELMNQSITTTDLEVSLNICVKMVQKHEFEEEIQRLQMKGQVKKRSTVRSLNPYLDDENILRVGGRLRHSSLDNDTKHPIILGNNNHLTPLIIAEAHERTLHGGRQLMLNYIRSKYWIIKAKSLIKKHIHKCLSCAKQDASVRTQIMGDLPAVRVTPSRPFLHSGVDFAGPYSILASRRRGAKTVKAYIAIFICMSTKAIHIELVGDLTSEAFIGAFRRFVARRGRCSDLWSDQGRNFVGANKELYDTWNEAKLQFDGKIKETLVNDGTQWHFIPAYSPNFGALWESGVKSIKYHLKRVLKTNLTFEEMTTILSQVEACLNSRPLCPIDDTDIENINALTPGHFLIGEAPVAVPTTMYHEHVKTHTLTRWQHLQKLVTDFWRRWQEEYLSRLQQRPKWMKRETEFNIGDIVLIKMDNLPPGKWSLGRIMEKHPGADGFTRVYSVYQGLDVVTAKASAEERARAPHHLLDILAPHQHFTVVDFRSRALKIIQELTDNGKIPIVVGGTNYYMESIVYNILVEDMSNPEELLWDRSTIKRDIEVAGPSSGEPDPKRRDINDKDKANELADSKHATKTKMDPINITDEIDKEKIKHEVNNEELLSNEDIHLRLMSIDPVMANRLHPNNRRKMLRSIEVWLKTGRRHSELLAEQKQREGRLRRPGATIVFWLKCEQSVHDERLDARVDAMIEQGLVQELLAFHDRHNKQRINDGKPPDYTRGVFQTLGFKEFHDYLMLSAEDRETAEGARLLRQSIENMKTGTRRYARVQNKTVRGRFLEHRNRDVPPIYELDTTNISEWDAQVKEKAIHIIESYLNESPCQYEPIQSFTKEEKKDLDPFSNNYCEVCKRILIGDREYGIHLKSNKHMKVLKKRNLEKQKKAISPETTS